MADRPARMIQGDRGEDQTFESRERLFVRCRLADLQGNFLGNLAIKFPDWSTNRERYSEPEDVFFPDVPNGTEVPDFQGWGIAEFFVGDIPPSIEVAQAKPCVFKAVHDPLPLNYAHTEVRTFRDGAFNRESEPSSTIKKQFRVALSLKTRITKRPII